MAEKTVATQHEPDRQQGSLPSTREETRYLRPAVDIYETPEALHVVADMPGVRKEDVDIYLENRVLTIEGRMSHEPVGRGLYSEFTLLNFYRQFQVGESVDQGRIQAKLHQGVLTIDLPKVEAAKPRQIEVQVG